MKKDLYQLIINELSDKNFRLTKLRKAIVRELNDSQKPQTAGEIIENLAIYGFQSHKTTIYRELTFLLNQNLVKKLNFGENQSRYELQALEHHHHAVCESCGQIKDIDCVEGTREIEKKLANLNFKVKNHLIEFFGLCDKCQ